MKFYPQPVNNTELLKKGFNLWILKVDTIPPHLITSFQGHYFNLSVYGRFIKQPIEALLKNIMQKKIPTLIVSISELEDLEEKIIYSYQKFEKVQAPQITCLSPIKELFIQYNYSGSVSTIHDLLPILEKNNVITSSYGLNLQLSEADNSFQLPYYTINEVFQCIDELKAENHVARK